MSEKLRVDNSTQNLVDALLQGMKHTSSELQLNMLHDLVTKILTRQENVTPVPQNTESPQN